MAGEINFGLLDPSIPGRVANSFYEGQQRRKQNVLSDLALSQAEQQAADEAAMRDAYKASAGDTNALLGALQQKGLYKQAEAVKQKQLEQEAKRVEMKAKVSDIAHKKLAMYRDALSNVSSPQDAMAWMDAQYSDPDVSVVLSSLGPREKSLASIPQDPMQLEQWKQKAALGMTKFVEMNKPSIHMQNLGDRSNVVAVPGLGGTPSTLSSSKIEMSPAEVAANSRGWASVGAAREANQVAREVAGVKRTQDVEMKLSDDYRASSKGFAETATAMNKVIGALKTADKNAGSALAAGTAFMKILDPNSVVRESELGMALNASGWFDRATNVVNVLKSGRVMTKEQKANLEAASKQLFEDAKIAQRQIDSAYSRRTKDYGGDPSRVLVDMGQGIEAANPAADIHSQAEAILRGNNNGNR